jgi:hypothetical protein
MPSASTQGRSDSMADRPDPPLEPRRSSGLMGERPWRGRAGAITVRNPATGAEIATVPLGGRRGLPPRDRRGAGGVFPVAEGAGSLEGRRAQAGGRAPPGAAPGAGGAPHARAGQAARAGARRGRLRGELLPVVRRGGPAAARPAPAPSAARPRVPCKARARGRGGARDALELPAGAGREEDRRGPGRGLHGRVEALGADAAGRAGAGTPPREAGLPDGALQILPRAGRSQARRSPPTRGSGCSPSPAPPAPAGPSCRRRAAPAAPLPRARGERAVRHPARREPR